MSNEEEMLVQKCSTQIISIGNPSHFIARSAHFLLPRADTTRLPVLPSPARSGGPVLDDELQMEFRGWPKSPILWTQWVAKVRARHEHLWRRLGIFDAIMSTTRLVRRDEGLLLQLLAFWSRDTSTFVFPWGEATVTLEDVAVLGGLPLLGSSACAPLPDALCRDMDALETIRIALNRCKSKKPVYSAWVKHFLARPPEKEDAGGELEHGAFLAMWLSAYVLPSPPFGVVQARVFPIAVRLARGQRVALAPAALASIYSSLSSPAGRAPLPIIQLWVWERFPELRPEMGTSPDADDDSGPERAAPRHNVRTLFDPRYIRAVFMSPNKFEWMPYGGRGRFGLPPGRRVRGQDISGSEELLSTARCLRPCELVGINCIQQYCPHRVARQLGMDQDVPGNVPRVDSDPEAAWATYEVEPSALAFIIPQWIPGVTVEYERWWEPHSSTYATDVADAARRKHLYISSHQRERKTRAVAVSAEDEIPRMESLNGGAVSVDLQPTPEDIVVTSDNKSDEESRKDVEVVTSASDPLQSIRVSMKTSGQRDNNCELLARNSAVKEEHVDISPSNKVKENTEPEKIVVCTRTLYYLTPFERKKDGEMCAGGMNLDQGIFQPKREVGTREMIMQASEAREAEKAELEKRIYSLKKQIWG
ncbi:unnamed protein product [Alopecurus aequalis]